MYARSRSPRSIGGVIDDAIDLFKASFRHCWLATALFCVVFIVASAVLQATLMRAVAGAVQEPGAAPGAVLAIYASPGVWGTYLVLMVSAVLLNLLLALSVLDVSRGRGVDALTHFGDALRLLPGGLLAMLLMLLGGFAGLLLLVIPGIYVVVRWMLWMVACADERRGGLAALGTSWRLVGGHWWRTLVVVSVVGIVAGIVTLLFGFVFGAIVGYLNLDVTTRLLGSQILQGVLQVFYLPAFTAATVALYHDLRLRKEGGDLEDRLGSIESSPA